MDAQRISIAAGAIKKADHAIKWIGQVKDSRYKTDLFLETKGNATSLEGHGEGKAYLQAALKKYSDEIIAEAYRLAAEDKRENEQVIADEVNGRPTNGLGL
jgi:hypothetical protein